MVNTCSTRDCFAQVRLSKRLTPIPNASLTPKLTRQPPHHLGALSIITLRVKYSTATSLSAVQFSCQIIIHAHRLANHPNPTPRRPLPRHRPPQAAVAIGRARANRIPRAPHTNIALNPRPSLPLHRILEHRSPPPHAKARCQATALPLEVRRPLATANTSRHARHRSQDNHTRRDRRRFFTQAQFPDFRLAARALLIKTYFEPAEQLALAALVNIELDQLNHQAAQVRETTDEPYRTGRVIRFRLDIVAAYNYTCALTGYRVTTLAGSSIIDAAHIHQFADSRNNDPTNGLALSKNAHWLFDQGLWSLDDNYQVIVAHDAFDESARDGKSLREYEGARIMLPKDERHWPDRKHLEWHRTNKLAES